MQGFSRIAKGFDEGMSMIKLTTININRLRKNDQIEYINTNAAVLTDVLTIDQEGTNLSSTIDTHSENLHPLEQASLYHLASLVRYQTDKGEGLKLMDHGLKLLEKFVKKNKEYRVYLDVARERAQKMSQEGGSVDQTSSSTSTTTSVVSSTPPPSTAGPPPEVKQPKVVKKGGPDLGKK
jgi:hypothetical protein